MKGDTLDYEEIAQRSPFELSGGQKRRVAIAGVIAMKPEVLILDEPTAGLDPKAHRDILKMIVDIHKKEGNTIGGTITCVIKNLPVGIGEPVFLKLQAELAKAMMNINAAKGFEYGSGFCGATMTGKEHNDLFNEDFTTKTNLSGGIQGGISNGMDIYFRVAFKPIATILRPQESVDKDGNLVIVEGKGRHDPCVLPRAVPVVENLAAFVLADLFLMNQIRRI